MSKQKINNFNGILNKRRIFSILLRVLPNFKVIQLSPSVATSRDVKNFFKSLRRMNEYPKLYDILKSKGFNMSLCDSIRNSNDNIPEQFFRSVDKVISNYKTPDKSDRYKFLKDEHFRFIEFNLYNLFPKGLSFSTPTESDLIDAVNKQASIGLPNPYLKKRSVLNELRIIYQQFIRGNLTYSQIVRYPSSAFMRLQIRASGLKFRVVCAVEVVHQFIESYFYKYVTSDATVLRKYSDMTIGLTQAEISSRVSQFKYYNTYSIDFSGWDLHRPQILSIISFELIRSLLPLSSYEDKILVYLRNVYLTLPLFHPAFSYVKRNRGTVSGSGFTSLDNSICNWIANTIIIFEYCKKKNFDPYKYDFKLLVNGDDLLLGVQDPNFDFSLYQELFKSRFSMLTRLECEMSKIGIDKCFYLGSMWINGVPYREESQMVASVVFGSGNFPEMSTNELLQSRFFEIFGNSGDTLKYWKRFKIPILKRRFVFSELVNPHRFNAHKREDFRESDKFLQKSSRGFWFNYNSKDYHDLNSLWSLR